MSKYLKNRMVIITLSLSLLLIISLGISYSYYLAKVVGNEYEKPLIVTSPVLDIIYENDNNIIGTNLTNGWNITKNISVSSTLEGNESNNNTKLWYTMKLYVDSNDFLTNTLKYSISENGNVEGEGILIDNASDIGILTGKNQEGIMIGIGCFAIGENSHNYTLTITYTGTNSEAKNKEFAMHVVVENIKTMPITYELNGGFNGDFAPTNGKIGDTIFISNPIKEHYTFTGWTLKGRGALIDGQNLTIGTSDIELEANWEMNIYTISYDLVGGTTNETYQTNGSYGTVLTLSNPTKTGYSFLGWEKSGAGASTATIEDGENADEKKITLGDGNLTLTAIWQANIYSIIYKLDGGKNNSANPSSATYGTTVLIKDPTKTGYAFLGWTVSGAKLDGKNLIVGTSDITLTASWKIVDSIPPTCSLSATAGSTKITATASDTGGSKLAGQGFSTSYGGETTKTVSSTGTITYYVIDGQKNTGTCTATISSTIRSDPYCTCGYSHAGACYTNVIQNGVYVGTKYCGAYSYDYTCESGQVKLNNSYCFKAN